jgi:GNAT superfamily N-acetyltransferase
MIVYTQSTQLSDLQGIMDLQMENRETSISAEELKQEGFVTVVHTLELLEQMNTPHPHTIAKDGDLVVAYVLTMLQSMQERIPILEPMFGQINSLSYRGDVLKDANYFVIGQCCVKKGYRGQGVFRGLYEKMRKNLSPHFKYVITEIATRNPRSIRAHEKMGFKVIHEFEDATDHWVIVLWDWR